MPTCPPPPPTIGHVLCSNACTSGSRSIVTPPPPPPPVVFGSEWHMRKVFEGMGQAKAFFKKGTRVKLSRWMSVWGAFAEFAPIRSTYLLILCYVCLRQGVVKGREGLPIFGASVSVASALAPGDKNAGQTGSAKPPPSSRCGRPDPEAGGPPQQRGGVQVEEPGEEHVASRVAALGSQQKERLGMGMVLTVAPIRERFGEVITQMKTRSGSLEWWVSAQLRSHSAGEPNGIVGSMTTAEAFVKCKFLPAECFAVGEPHGGARGGHGRHEGVASSSLGFVGSPELGPFGLRRFVAGQVRRALEQGPGGAAALLKRLAPVVRLAAALGCPSGHRQVV